MTCSAERDVSTSRKSARCAAEAATSTISSLPPLLWSTSRLPLRASFGVELDMKRNELATADDIRLQFISDAPLGQKIQKIFAVCDRLASSAHQHITDQHAGFIGRSLGLDLYQQHAIRSAESKLLARAIGDLHRTHGDSEIRTRNGAAGCEFFTDTLQCSVRNANRSRPTQAEGIDAKKLSPR